MALLKTRCPECNAGLKSATGFNVGQTVCCPKCETYFAVEEPDEENEKEDEEKEKEGATKKPVKASAADEDDGDATPKKKKKKAYDEDEEPTRSYKNSPLRYAVLGVLVVVMLVLGYLLYDKRKTERELADANESSSSSNGNVQIPPPPGGPNPVRPPGPGPIGPIPVPNPKFPKGKQPPPNDKGGGGPPLPFIGTASSATPAQLGKFKSDLVGTWAADLGDGVTEELAYTANGTFTSKLTGPAPAMISGKYMVTGSVTAKVFKIQLDTPAGSRTVTVTYEDNELQHPTLQPGVTGTFRKK